MRSSTASVGSVRTPRCGSRGSLGPASGSGSTSRLDMTSRSNATTLVQRSTQSNPSCRLERNVRQHGRRAAVSLSIGSEGPSEERAGCRWRLRARALILEFPCFTSSIGVQGSLNIVALLPPSISEFTQGSPKDCYGSNCGTSTRYRSCRGSRGWRSWTRAPDSSH